MTSQFTSHASLAQIDDELRRAATARLAREASERPAARRSGGLLVHSGRTKRWLARSFGT